MTGSMAYTIGALVILGVFASCASAIENVTNATAAPSASPSKYNTTYLPTVYVTVDLKMTWADFCMLEAVFRSKVAPLIFTNKGIATTPGQLRIHNYDVFCSNPDANKYKKAVLILYVTKHNGGHQGDIDETRTIKVFEQLSYIVESRNQWELGRVFDDEVAEVGMGGENASPIPEKVTEFEHTWIAIAIATAIVLLIVIILVIIHFVKKPKRDLKDEVRYEPRDPEQGAVITRAPEEERRSYQEKPPITSEYDSSTKL